MIGHTLTQNLAIRQAGTPASYASAQHLGFWIDTKGYDSTLFVVSASTITANCALKVYEATSESGANARLIASLSDGVLGTADSSRVAAIEVRSDLVSKDYPYVGVRVEPSAATVLSAVALQGNSRILPTENTTAQSVAFVER